MITITTKKAPKQLVEKINTLIQNENFEFKNHSNEPQGTKRKVKLS